MAQVWLSRRDCAEGTLPALCLKCGAPASECVEKELAGTLLWGAPLTWLLSAIWDGQSAKLRVPMCAKHRDYWRQRRLILSVGSVVMLLSVLAVPVWFWLAGVKLDLDGPAPDREAAVVNTAALLFSALFLFVLVYGTSGIRVKEIHEDGVLLFGVSLKFAHVYEGEHFLGGIDVDEALDKYGRRPRRRGKDVTDET
jgi:hypothetical protein